MSSAFTRNFMSLLAEREEISRGVMAGLSARMIDSAFQSTRFSVLDLLLLCRVDRPGEGFPSNRATLPAPATETLTPSFHKSHGQKGGHRPG